MGGEPDAVDESRSRGALLLLGQTVGTSPTSGVRHRENTIESVDDGPCRMGLREEPNRGKVVQTVLGRIAGNAGAPGGTRDRMGAELRSVRR